MTSDPNFEPLLDSALLVAAEAKGFAAAEGVELALLRETSWANIRDRLAVEHVSQFPALSKGIGRETRHAQNSSRSRTVPEVIRCFRWEAVRFPCLLGGGSARPVDTAGMDGLPGYGVGGGSGPELGIRVKVATLRCTVARPAERAPEGSRTAAAGFPVGSPDHSRRFLAVLRRNGVAMTDPQHAN